MIPRDPLVTDRTRLEPIGPDHFEGFCKAQAVSLPELSPWVVWADDPENEGTRAFIDREPGEWKAARGWAFAIIFDSEVAGAVALNRHDPPFASAQLGYWIRSDLSGRRLATEAAAAAVDFGFNVAGLHRIELHAAPENIASIRVAEKLGFLQEGLLRDGGRDSAGNFHDMLVFGLLAGDRSRP